MIKRNVLGVGNKCGVLIFWVNFEMTFHLCFGTHSGNQNEFLAT
jgi:hypothetical protein